MKKLIAAHRGDHAAAPENTLEAFEAAIQCGADMIEFDVRRTGDGVLVIHHDADIGGLPIANLSYSALRSANSKSLPLFAEVLSLAASRIQIDVELKETGYELEALNEISARRFEAANVLITSFHLESVRLLAPISRTGLLIENTTWERGLRLFAESGAELLAPRYTMLKPGSGVPLLPWTVNEQASISMLLAMPEVIGVITDRPREALALRRVTPPSIVDPRPIA